MSTHNICFYGEIEVIISTLSSEPYHNFLYIIIWAISWRNLLMLYANNKDTDLISAFVVHCLDSIIPVLAKSKISRLWLVSVAELAGLSLTWLQTPKTGFLVRWLILPAALPPSPTTIESEHDKTNKMTRAQRRLRSAWASPSLIRVPLSACGSLSYPLSARRGLWSDWANVQADLSLRWAHKSFCRFYHDTAQMNLFQRWFICLWF